MEPDPRSPADLRPLCCEEPGWVAHSSAGRDGAGTLQGPLTNPQAVLGRRQSLRGTEMEKRSRPFSTGTEMP